MTLTFTLTMSNYKVEVVDSDLLYIKFTQFHKWLLHGLVAFVNSKKYSVNSNKQSSSIGHDKYLKNSIF